MSRYLLDTNACIHYLNHSHPALARRILETGPERLAVSSLSVAELHYGAARSSRPESNRERIRVFLNEVRTIFFDDRCGERFGRIKADLVAAGRQIPDFDAAIAATAFAHGLTVVSNDQHMRRITGLALEDWTAT